MPTVPITTLRSGDVTGCTGTEILSRADSIGGGGNVAAHIQVKRRKWEVGCLSATVVHLACQVANDRQQKRGIVERIPI